MHGVDNQHKSKWMFTEATYDDTQVPCVGKAQFNIQDYLTNEQKSQDILLYSSYITFALSEPGSGKFPYDHPYELILFSMPYYVTSHDNHSDYEFLCEYFDSVDPLVMNDHHFTANLSQHTIGLHERCYGEKADGNVSYNEVINYHSGKSSIKGTFPSSSVYTPVVQIKENNGGGSSYNPPPTIGLDHWGKRLITNGLVLNGQPFDVEKFKTHMPMQYTEVGKLNNLEMKIYEDRGLYNIEMVQLGVGVKEIGTPLSQAQAIFEIDVASFHNNLNNPEMKEFRLVDPYGLIDDDVEIIFDLVPCSDSGPECLYVSIQWKYLKSPDYPVLMTNVFDRQRSSNTDYFNDGFQVIDPNKETADPNMETVQEEYQYVCNDPPLSEVMVPTRANCHFRELVAIWN